MARFPFSRLVFGCCCWLTASLAFAARPPYSYFGDDAPPTPPSRYTANRTHNTNVGYDGQTHDPAACACDSCCCYRWQVWADGLFLTRSSAENIPLAFGDPIDPKGSEIFGTDDLDSGFNWGPNVGVYYSCNACTSIGIEYFSVQEWSSAGVAAGNISVQFPSFPYLPEFQVPGDPTSGYGVGNFLYTSRLHNAEINLRRRSSCFEWLTVLAGFRWIELGEEFHASFATGGTMPYFDIDTNNHLYGGQLGAIVLLHSSYKWTVDTWIKAGLCANVMDQDTFEDFRSAGGGTTYVNARTTSAAFTGDLGVKVVRRVTQRLSARAGYNLLWLEGVALAPEQLDASDPASGIAGINHKGGIFCHGGFVGLDFVW
ncbi:MAG: hypothetical protein FJ276_22040 [Planctomycetes bacterium]|nr:hypothetical protein [Planctomycetota bacterium]